MIVTLSIVDNDGIVAILGHEMGHWKLNHTIKVISRIDISLLHLFFGFGEHSISINFL